MAIDIVVYGCKIQVITAYVQIEENAWKKKRIAVEINRNAISSTVEHHCPCDGKISPFENEYQTVMGDFCYPRRF